MVKNLTMATDIQESAHGQWSKWLFCGQTTVYPFDHRKYVFRSWPCSKLVFLVKFRSKILG